MVKYILLTLLCAGCVAPGKVFRGDARATPEQRAAVDKAAEFWNDTGVTEPIDVVWGFDVGHWRGVRTIHLVMDDNDQGLYEWALREESDDPNPSTASGFNFSHIAQAEESEILFLNTRLMKGDDFWEDPSKGVHVVAVHEFGHHLGLNHDGGETSIMFPASGPKTQMCLSPEDVAEVREHVDGLTRPKGICPN